MGGAALMLPCGQRNAARNVVTEIPTTEVIVHYQVPRGQRFLPIAIGSAITMVHIGKDNEKFVYGL